MRALLARLLCARVGAVWAALVAVTMASVGISASSRASHQLLGAVAMECVLAIAIVKVRFIGMEFMEIRGSAYVLKVVLHVWCAGAFIMLSVLYLARF